jgi:hypothetical protein
MMNDKQLVFHPASFILHHFFLYPVYPVYPV